MKVKDPAMIRRWRKQERFSQRDLAALVRRSQNTIHLLETGGMKTLSEDLAISIASRLHVPWEDLFELEEHEIMPKTTHESHNINQRQTGTRGAPQGHERRLLA